MGRKCSTKSGCPNDTNGYRVVSFPKDKDEKRVWVVNLPNALNPDVAEHIGVCEKHWKEGYEVKIVRRGH